MRAVEGEGAGFRAGEEPARLLVRHQIVGFPRIPQRAYRVQCLLGAHIPVGRVEESAAPEVSAGERVEGGHHIPGGTPAGEVIETGEPAGELVGLVEGRVDRARQAEIFGDRGQRGQHCEGVGTADDVLIEDLARAFAERESLGEEEEIESAPLCRAGGVFETAEIDLATGIRMPPCGVVVDAAEIGAEDDLLTGSAHGGLAQAVA